MNDPATSPAFRRTARPIDEPKALAMLREGVPARRVARTFGVRGARVLELARRNGIALRPGTAARPFDEARALELLRAGWPAYKVRLDVGAGNLRKIVAIARENGISLHVRRTNRTLRRQEKIINTLRFHGYSWEQIAARLGYGRGALASIKRRAERESRDAGVKMHAKTRRAIVKRLRALNPASGWEDADSLARLAADPRRHWLLPPEEIAIARHFKLLRNAQ